MSRSPRPSRRTPGAWILALLLGAALGACMTPPPPRSTTDASSADTALERGFLTLGPNDVLRVEVYGHPEISTDEKGAKVDSEGLLHVPLAGPVSVEGKTVAEAADAIETALTVYYREPDVSVWVIDYASRVFYVAGHVYEPGPKTLDRPLTLLQALSYGGGARPGADRKEAYVLRNHGGELEVVRFNSASPNVACLVAVRPDDVLFVRQTGAGSFQEQILPILSGLGIGLTPLVITAAD